MIRYEIKKILGNRFVVFFFLFMFKDFHNYYSPSNPEWARSQRYVVVNTETGQTYELGVDVSTQSVHNRNNQ